MSSVAEGEVAAVGAAGEEAPDSVGGVAGRRCAGRAGAGWTASRCPLMPEEEEEAFPVCD